MAVDRYLRARARRHYANVPGWASSLPSGCAAHHTRELVRCDDMSGARVLIIGGGQSAYE